MHHFILRLVLTLAVLLPQMAHADDMGYYIRHYHVDAVVHENNEWDIKEDVDLTFTEPRHGFYRYVPYTFSLPLRITDKKGVEKVIRPHYYNSIKDVSVDGDDYEVIDEDENIMVKIGNANRTVEGDKHYTINYRYCYTDDRLARHTNEPWDIVYHTLLPVDCNVPIEKFSFSITFDNTLPDDIADKVKVMYGHYGDSQYISFDDIHLQIANNTITGEYNSIPPLNTFTIIMPLPEGFFTDVPSHSNIPFVVFLTITVALISVCIVLALTIRQPSPVKSIEFYPPDGISSAEVGVIIDESPDLIDFISLIPWWASKGYISIEEKVKGTKLFGGKKTTTIIHRKTGLPQNAQAYETAFFDIILPNDKQQMDLSDMQEHPSAFASAQRKLGKVFEGEKSLTSISNKIWFLFLMLIFGTLTFGFASADQSFDIWGMILGALFWTAPATVAFFLIDSRRSSKMMNRQWYTYLLRLVRLGLVGVACVLYIIFMTDITEGHDSYFNTYTLGVMFIGAYLAIEMSGRFTTDTPYRTQMVGKLMGLKEFIETAEVPQLKSLQEEDSEYFYKIIPFAMVFGLSDKWANLFKNLPVERPSWYQSTDNMNSLFSTSSFVSSLSSMNKSIEIIRHDSSSSSDGGYSSGGGGGFSGGGGGGGGCGSW